MSTRRFVTKAVYLEKQWYIFDNEHSGWVKEHYNPVHFEHRKDALELAGKLNRGERTVNCYENLEQ